MSNPMSTCAAQFLILYIARLLANRLGTALIERKIVYALKAGTLRSLNVDAATLRIVSYW